METTNNTTKANDILTILYNEAKECNLILDSNGTPDKEKTICYLIEIMMSIAGDIFYPDLSPIITAVCHYARTATDSDQVEKAVNSLNELQELMNVLRGNLCTLSIFESALHRYNQVRDGKEAEA